MFIDVHILQSVPPSNINRDETGSPKSALVGGTRRARVSSQAWKRATRKRFAETLDASDLGLRTKHLAEVVGRRIAQKNSDISAEDSEKQVAAIFGTAGIKVNRPKVKSGAPSVPAESTYLVFLSASQIDALANLAVELYKSGDKPDKKAVTAIMKSDHSIDVALFGRMVADDAELNVDAAVQVAHAISVQAVEPEFDYYTAVDDFQEERQETGAGMIGTVEFGSSTLYRYASLNVKGLAENLGDSKATVRAAAAFVESFALSMPSGKQNSFANNTVPDAILVCVRQDQPISLVGAFNDAVLPQPGISVITAATQRLVERNDEIASAYRAPQEIFHTALGDAKAAFTDASDELSIDDLVSRVGSVISAELGIKE